MALPRDLPPREEEFCRGIRRDILEVGAATNEINEAIRQINEAIATVIDLLIQTRSELGTTTDPQSRRRLRSEVQRVEGIRDQLKQNLISNKSTLNEFISQLKQFQLIAASRGC